MKNLKGLKAFLRHAYSILKKNPGLISGINRPSGDEGRLDWGLLLQDITKNDQLEARIAELEKEKSEATQEYQAALRNVANKIIELEGKCRVVESQEDISMDSKDSLELTAEKIPVLIEPGLVTKARKRRRTARGD